MKNHPIVFTCKRKGNNYIELLEKDLIDKSESIS